MPLDRKIAFIDLIAEKIRVKPIPVALREKFLGGRGMNMHLLSRRYTSSLYPFSPENLLIFGAGLLTGCLNFGLRITITSKSPESGHLCELVCSLFRGGSVNPEKSAIRIKKDDLNTSMNMPILCRQCKEMKRLPGKKAEGEKEKKKFVGASPALNAVLLALYLSLPIRLITVTSAGESLSA